MLKEYYCVHILQHYKLNAKEKMTSIRYSIINRIVSFTSCLLNPGDDGTLFFYV